MFCNTYSLSSLLSPTNASFASSMAQEISLFPKSLQEQKNLLTNHATSSPPLLVLSYGRKLTVILLPGKGVLGQALGTDPPGKWSQHQACWRSRSVWKTLLRHTLEFLGSPVCSLESDVMTPMGPLQPGVFYDSMGQHHLEGLRTSIDLYLSQHPTWETRGKTDLLEISASDRTTNELWSVISWCGI